MVISDVRHGKFYRLQSEKENIASDEGAFNPDNTETFS